MSQTRTVEIRIPDLGDPGEVDVIEVLVEVGDNVEIEQSLITLESDKASMEIPAEHAGEIEELRVSLGDKVTQGDLIGLLKITVDADADSTSSDSATPEGAAPAAASAVPETQKPGPARDQHLAQKGTRPLPPMPGADLHAQVLVLGSGPGGYTAAFRAADLGRQVVLVEKDATLGGVCLNVGCIPSKALLHAAKVIDEAASFGSHGLTFGKPEIDLDKLRHWKDSVVGRLVGGLATMADQRKVEVVRGTGRFLSPHELEVEGPDGRKTISFESAIIAVGSRNIQLPFVPHNDPRVWDSTAAQTIGSVPERLLIVGGGIIGLEMATVYHSLGSKITVVELLDRLMPGADKDIVQVYKKHVAARYENIYLKTKLTGMEATDKGLKVTFEGGKAPAEDLFDAALVSVGRRPNGREVNAEAAGVFVDERGFIPANAQLRTNVEHIFAIGDVVGQPMLAHKAVHEGKVAAEVIAGHRSSFDARVIPSVAYTDPEVAWVGLTEEEAKAQGVAYEKGSFPWAASGRSLAMDNTAGRTKLLFDKESGRVLGAGIVGPHAGDLIAEAALAIEMGCDAQDIGLTVHPHPTLSETVAFAAEAFEGTLTDLYIPKKR